MVTLRIVLVANPGARNVTPAVIAATVARWSAAGQLEVIRSRAGSIDGLAPLVTGPAPADAVVVLGGDGALNQVANQLAELGSDSAIVPLPAGTTNVVSRNLGLPRDLPAASELALAALQQGHTARRGWGRLNGRGFLANAGIGLDAAVVARTEAHPRAKRRFGHLLFGAAALAEVRATKQAPRLSVTGAGCPETAPRTGAFWLLALVDHPYSYAGPRPLRLLDADPAPPHALAVLCVAPMSGSRLAGLAVRTVVGRRGVLHRPGVTHGTTAGPVRVNSDRPVRAQADGEPLASTMSFELHFEPDALRMVIPRAVTSKTGT